MTIRKKAAVLLLSYLFGAVLVLGGFALQANARADALERANQVTYARAFSELAASLDSLDTALQKSRYATSPAVAASVCADVYGSAMAAQSAISSLPFASFELEKTASFIARAGDYKRSSGFIN